MLPDSSITPPQRRGASTRTRPRVSMHARPLRSCYFVLDSKLASDETYTAFLLVGDSDTWASSAGGAGVLHTLYNSPADPHNHDTAS